MDTGQHLERCQERWGERKSSFHFGNEIWKEIRVVKVEKQNLSLSTHLSTYQDSLSLSWPDVRGAIFQREENMFP